jgi:hypothetical protein
VNEKSENLSTLLTEITNSNNIAESLSAADL